MLKESDILYESGLYWVCKSTRFNGFEVWRNGLTHSKLVARIGWPGEEGLSKARKEADKRAEQDKAKGLGDWLV